MQKALEVGLVGPDEGIAEKLAAAAAVDVLPHGAGLGHIGFDGLAQKFDPVVFKEAFEEDDAILLEGHDLLLRDRARKRLAHQISYFC